MITAAAATLAIAPVRTASAAPKGTVAGKYAAIVVDTATGRVLYDADADARRFPASLTKMMTLYVLFEDLERGRLKLSSRLTVSRAAAGQPPSKIGFKAGDTIAVEDAIKALVTKSANDVAAAIGENLSGSVPAFADRMTRTARALGMTGTRFRNASGLPDPGQYTTARDMMKLGVALQVRFPAYYEYFKTGAFTFRGRTHGNHNKLLGRIDGVDGIKTGYINASGFNLVTSVKRDGRKIVAVVMGGQSGRSRDAHMAQLIATFLPKASRGRGYDDDLIAAVRSAPKLAASAPMPEVAVASVAAPARSIAHPPPPSRPVVVGALGDQPEIVTASVAAVPQRGTSSTRAVRTTLIPIPPLSPEPSGPVSLATATLPSSAAEAFADVGPVDQGSTDDALAAMIDDSLGAVPAPPRRAAPPKAPRLEVAALAEAPPKRAAVRAPVSGWAIQIGAVESEAAASRLLDRARNSGGSALAEASPMTEVFAKGSQTYVRARFAGFESEKAASRACAALKKNAMACYALRL